VLPEQVPRHVRFVPVGYAALVAIVVELVLPDVNGELGLVGGGLEAHLARHVALAQVHHQPEWWRQIVHSAEAAPEPCAHVVNVHAWTQVAQQLAVVEKVGFAHVAHQAVLLMHLSVVQVQLLM
jgi:hypothetical protein